MKNTNLPPLSVTEAARILGISARTVRRLVDRGALKAARVGGITVILRSELRRATGLDTAQPFERLTPLLAPLEAAARLGCSPAQLRHLVEAGQLPPVRLGRLQRFRCEQIAGIIKQGGCHAPRQ